MTAGTNAQEHEATLMTAKQTPQLHTPRLVSGAHIRAQVHGTSRIGRLNAAVAVKITRIVGTMYCAYVFPLLAWWGCPRRLSKGR